MNIEKEREAFEKEALKHSGGWATFNKAYGDVYENRQLNFAWSMWLAAKQQAVPKGFVVVNKSDLSKVLNCVTDDWLIDTNSMENFNKIESLILDEVKSMIQEAQK